MEKHQINLFREIPYGFTFTIPSQKKVYYDKRRRRYGQMSHQTQATFLNQLLTKIIWQDHFTYIDWVFEKHEPGDGDKIGRLHIHGYALVKKQYEHHNPIEALANSFYTHNGIVGISPNVYPRLINIQRTNTDVQHWLDYINKQQRDNPYHSPYNSQKFLINSIDNPLCNITAQKVEVEF